MCCCLYSLLNIYLLVVQICTRKQVLPEHFFVQLSLKILLASINKFLDIVFVEMLWQAFSQDMKSEHSKCAIVHTQMNNNYL